MRVVLMMMLIISSSSIARIMFSVNMSSQYYYYCYYFLLLVSFYLLSLYMYMYWLLDYHFSRVWGSKYDSYFDGMNWGTMAIEPVATCCNVSPLIDFALTQFPQVSRCVHLTTEWGTAEGSATYQVLAWK